MVIRDKYPDALGDAERIYQLTAAIAIRLAKRSAEGVRQRRRVVPLSVLHGKSAEADDFAAFGDHVNRSLTDHTETSNEPPSEMLGITAGHEADVLRCLARDRLAARFATIVRPSGVNHAIADADVAVRRRVDVDPAREITSAPAFDTPTHRMTVLQRVRRLSICSGLAQQSLRGQMQWDTQHWNDVLRQRDGLNYEIGPRRAVRQRDLDALADAEQLHITRDVLDVLKTLEKQGAVEVAVTWWATLKLDKGDSVSPLQKLVDIDKSFAALDPQCSRWRFREPADRTVVRAYLKLRDRLLTG